VSWRVVTSRAPWPPRSDHNAELIHSDSMNADHLFVIAGRSNVNQGVVFLNDVWASSDYGMTWSLINAAAGFTAREGASMEVSHSGMMILASGFNGGESNQGENDIWVSLTGGRSWNRCVRDGNYADRWWTSIELDPSEKLIIAGGYISATGNSNDVWRSDQSFSDVKFIASQCNLTVPSCSPGLQCWPKTPDDWCTPVCVSGGSSSSGDGGGNGLAIALAVIFILLCVVVSYLLYIERSIRYGTIDQSMCAPSSVVDCYIGHNAARRAGERPASDTGSTGGEAYSALGR